MIMLGRFAIVFLYRGVALFIITITFLLFFWVLIR